MRRYDDPVEVRKGADEDPDQFLWRGRLWQVREVVAHWVETGPWWQGGSEAGSEAGAEGGRPVTATDLVAERELWRVEAGRGMPGGRPASEPQSYGVFDLSFDWTDGRWQLVGCLD